MHLVAFRDSRLATPHSRIPKQTLSASTVKGDLLLISHIFTTCVQEWGMDELPNPVSKIKKPKANPGRTRRLTDAEQSKLLHHAHNHPNVEMYAIVVIALETAMRQGEILKATWENINWQKRILHLPITKNGDARDVPLSIKAFGILHDYLPRKSEGKIFSYTSNGLKSSYRHLVKTIGIKNLTFHDLRHSAISSLLERGLNTIEVSTISGHKSMSMLKRYAHLQVFKLVKKLDPKPKAKRDRLFLRSQLPDYPVIVTKMSKNFRIEFPDFIGLELSEYVLIDAMEKAKAILLHKVISLICDGHELPEPSLEDNITLRHRNSTVEMISPL